MVYLRDYHLEKMLTNYIEEFDKLTLDDDGIVEGEKKRHDLILSYKPEIKTILSIMNNEKEPEPNSFAFFSPMNRVMWDKYGPSGFTLDDFIDRLMLLRCHEHLDSLPWYEYYPHDSVYLNGIFSPGVSVKSWAQEYCTTQKGHDLEQYVKDNSITFINHNLPKQKVFLKLVNECAEELDLPQYRIKLNVWEREAILVTKYEPLINYFKRDVMENTNTSYFVILYLLPLIGQIMLLLLLWNMFFSAIDNRKYKKL